MSQDKQNDSLLANSLFSKALGEAAHTQSKKAQEAVNRGALEQAKEHLKRAIQEHKSAWLMTPSPLLDEDENKRLLELRTKYKDEILANTTPREEIGKFAPPETGDFELDNYLSTEEKEMEELILLERKAGNLEDVED
jgi:hypothetical protein